MTMNSNKCGYISILCALIFVFEGCLGSQFDINSYRPYEFKPLDGVFGAEIKGITLKDMLPGQDDDIINQIKEDFEKYKILIIRDQGILTAEEQMNITKWFRGELNCIHDDHPNAPHRCVVTLANSPEKGLDRRGRKWHIDGSQRENIDDIVVYHMVEIPKDGKTVFLPSKECVERFTKEQRERFERLWYLMVNDLVMPYLIVHPFTGDVVIRAHLYNFRTFFYDYGTKDERKVDDARERQEIFKELWMHFEDKCWNLTYTHTWVHGDLLITDNMAMAHRATKEAFLQPEHIGDRVLHRTSTLSSRIPKPVRGFLSAEWEEAQKCVKDDDGLCITIENDKNVAEDAAAETVAINKDEL